MLSKKELLDSLAHRDTQASPPSLDTRADAGRRWLWLGVLLLVVLACLAAALRPGAASVGKAATDQAAPWAATAKPAMASRLEAAGFVTARRTATISARTMGVIQSLLVDVGDHVEKDQVIAKIDDSRARIDMAQAQASAKLWTIRVHQAEIALAEAERILQRQRSLIGAGFTSPAQLTSLETDLQLKQVAVDSARQENEVAKIDVARNQVMLGEYVIRAPFAGVVLARNAQEGETIAPSSAGGGFTRTGICTIADIKSLEIEVDINEQLIDQIRPKQQVRAISSVPGAQSLAGEVLKLEPATDRAKATVRVKIGISDARANLLPGMSVRVTFL